MGRKLDISLNEAEQINFLIYNLSGGEKTNRLFNFTLNFNRKELERILEPASESLHDMPEGMKEYNQKLRELKIKHSVLPKTQYRNGKEVPMEHIKDRSKFNSKALDLKKEYQDSLDEWEELQEENIDMKEEINVTVDLYICPAEHAPEVSAGLEYFLAYMLDYSEEEGIEQEMAPHVEEVIHVEKKNTKKKKNSSSKKSSKKKDKKDDKEDAG